MDRTHIETEEFVTIIARSATEAMGQFKARSLDLQGYAIHGRIGPHKFALVTGDASLELFKGEQLVAAIFSRRVPAVSQHSGSKGGPDAR